MILSDGELWDALKSGELTIEPPPSDISAIEPASLDLHLNATIFEHRTTKVGGMKIDPSTLDITDHLDRYTTACDVSDHSYVLEPGGFIIGSTLELVGLPAHFAARVEGRSSLARLGMGVHLAAPKIDPGFRNHITLEMVNFGPFSIELIKGMKICTLIVERLGEPAKQTYRGQFQG